MKVIESFVGFEHIRYDLVSMLNRDAIKVTDMEAEADGQVNGVISIRFYSSPEIAKIAFEMLKKSQSKKVAA